MNEPGGVLYLLYEMGIATGLFPLLIFLGVGAMTDFTCLARQSKNVVAWWRRRSLVFLRRCWARLP